MSAQDSLNPLQFKYEEHPFVHYVEASSQGEPVGGIEWHKKTGKIQQVTVKKEHRRKGVATSLFKHAKTIAPIKHNNKKTPEGTAWAKSVGEHE